MSGVFGLPGRPGDQGFHDAMAALTKDSDSSAVTAALTGRPPAQR